jgi:hypothetical protein
MVLASVCTADGMPPPLVGHPRTSQVRESKNHIRCTVSYNASGSDVLAYAQHQILDILPPHQPPPMVAGQYIVPPSHPLPRGPTPKQVVLAECVLTRAIRIHTHTGTLLYIPYSGLCASNPTSGLGGWFVYSGSQTRPWIPPGSLVQRCVPYLHHLLTLPGSISSQPADFHDPASL